MRKHFDPVVFFIIGIGCVAIAVFTIFMEHYIFKDVAIATGFELSKNWAVAFILIAIVCCSFGWYLMKPKKKK